MAGKVRVNGTNYTITGGKCRVNGTSYSIKKGRALVGGTGYDITFGTPVTLTVGVRGFNSYVNAKVEVFVNGSQIGTVWATALNDQYTSRQYTVNAGDTVLISAIYCYFEDYDYNSFDDVNYGDDGFDGTITASGGVYFYVT